MRIPRFRTIIGLISGPAIIVGGLATFTLASAGPAAAGQPVTQPLTPPPPSFETCKTVGNGFICDGARTLSYGPDDTGIACGSGAGTFDIFDQGTHNQHAIRFYNAAGDLTKRVIYDQYFSQFTNPLTGAAVPYTQHNTTTDVLAVPGDFTSATETTTGQANFTVPHMGAVVLNAGRVVFGADGTLEFSAGPQGFLDYFYNGNTAAVAELCTALGAS
jgi:hypothetical protein